MQRSDFLKKESCSVPSHVDEVEEEMGEMLGDGGIARGEER